MKTIKQLLLVALTVVVFSISTFALTEGDWEFQLLDDVVTITGYIGEGGDVVIPETIFGRPVTKVEIDFVHNSGFSNATSLEFPGTVKEIKKCGAADKLKKLTLNEGTEVICPFAFYYCNITSVNLPNSIKRIEDSAFEGCQLLSKANFHNGLEYIGNKAFCGTAFTSLDFSDLSEKCIFASNAGETFRDCKYLISVKLSKNIVRNMFSGCSLLKEVEIPSGVTFIPYCMFINCSSLESIILPTSLKEIQGSAFLGTKLKEIVIPVGTTTIESEAFANNPNLKSIYIPDTITKIASNIIYNSNNCIIYCSANSYVAQQCKEHSISYLTDKSVNSEITVLYNGTRVSFHTYDQNPELINNRTLVPLRSIFEAMGAEISWDGATSTATAVRDGVTIKITIGANEIYKDGVAIPVDVPAQIVNSRTMVPTRVIAEAFGADVEWVGSGRTVLITE